MLLRCASRLAAGPAVIATGMIVATGVAATLALSAGAVGAALIGKRMWEERKGWRASGTAEAAPPVDAVD
jgi:hypothetical protein